MKTKLIRPRRRIVCRYPYPAPDGKPGWYLILSCEHHQWRPGEHAPKGRISCYDCRRVRQVVSR